MSPLADAASKPHAPPAPRIFAILLIVLPLLYSTFVAPLVASGANPDVNVFRLTVNVADFDGGEVGAAFTAFISANPAGSALVPNNGASPVTMPGWAFKSAADGWSAGRLRDAVADSSAYASIYVAAGASAALAGALASPAAAAVYDPSTALVIVWDEGRNAPVTAARIAGPLKGLLVAFSEAFAARKLAAWLPSANASALPPALAAKVLARPIYFSEASLFPQTAPGINIAATVGQILLVVFSLVICNMVYGPLAALSLRAPPGLRRAGARVVLLATFAAMLAAAFSTILIGLSHEWNTTKLTPTLAPGVVAGATFANGTFDGARWAQIWAVQWLQVLVFLLWLALPGAAGKMEAAPALLAPMIIFNALSVSIDLSDPGFQFFLYAPFWHASELMRYILFGSLSSRVSMHVGVLFLWFGVELLAFVGLHARLAAAEAVGKSGAAEAATTAAAPADVKV